MAFDSFCFLAFTHLQITPAGTARLCGIAQEEIAQGGKPLSFYRHRLDEVWNSDYMVRTHRAMAREKGLRLSSLLSRRGVVGESYRTQMNGFWSGELRMTRQQMLESLTANDYRSPSSPIPYQLDMGNLCNLACRSCSGDFSTRILADPVLPQWNPGLLHDFPKWQGGLLILGP